MARPVKWALGARSPRDVALNRWWARLLAAMLVMGALPAAAPAAVRPAWTTYNHDAARSGIDPDSVLPLAPALAWAHAATLDGSAYAQPLVYGSHVYAATENNLVYALDAASGAVIWQRSAGVPVPQSKLPCGNIGPSVGITSTPVIDPATNTLYVVADTWDGTHAHHLLEGFDLSTGAATGERDVDPPGSTPETQLQRAALALDAGQVVIAYGGNAGDCGNYHGWLVAAREDGSGPLRSYMVPTAREGAIWQAGNGPAVDAAGNIFAATGNSASSDPANYDGGDSVIRLDSALNLLDHFAPSQWVADNEQDSDLGSGAPLLLPGGLIFQAGKSGLGYLLSASSLGGTGSAAPLREPSLFHAPVCPSESLGGAVYSSGTIYVSCNSGLRALTLTATPASFSARWSGPADATGPPILAAGRVWDIGLSSHRLYALDPSTGKPSFSAPLPAGQEHFISPSAGGGRLFAASGGTVTALSIAGVPSVTITSPSSDTVVGVPSVAVSGTASDPAGIASLALNGHSVSVAADGTWTSTADGLQPGANALVATLTDKLGASEQASVRVIYAPGRTGAPYSGGPPAGSLLSGSPPGPAASVAGAALACAKSRLKLIDVVPARGRILIFGAASPALAGQRVRIKFLVGGRIVARTRVGVDGLFATTAPLPPRKIRASSRAQYAALVAGVTSAALQLHRRIYLTSATRRDNLVRLSGRVNKPYRAGATVRILRQTSCRSYRPAAAVKLRADGSFAARFAAATGRAGVYRAQTKVRAGRHLRAISSRPHPV